MPTRRTNGGSGNLGASRRASRRETPDQVKRRRFIAVWCGLRDAYGGDGWEGWTDDEIVAAMEGWVMDPAYMYGMDPRSVRDDVDELLDQSFDPRHVRGVRKGGGSASARATGGRSGTKAGGKAGGDSHLYLKHESGAIHDLGVRRTAALRREILAGRGGPEVLRLVESGYTGYLGDGGDAEDFEGLDAHFRRRA